MIVCSAVNSGTPGTPNCCCVYFVPAGSYCSHVRVRAVDLTSWPPMMAAVSEEDMPGLVGLDASSVHASSGLNAADTVANLILLKQSLLAAKAFELKKSQNAAKR